MSCELWSINRMLRWTGWRLYVEVDSEIGAVFDPKKPSRIGFKFYGWSWLRE